MPVLRRRDEDRLNIFILKQRFVVAVRLGAVRKRQSFFEIGLVDVADRGYLDDRILLKNRHHERTSAAAADHTQIYFAGGTHLAPGGATGGCHNKRATI